jgi:hypothetical protein
MLKKLHIPKWVNRLDKLMDLCIELGAVGFGFGIFMFIALKFNIVFDEEFSIRLIVSGLILIFGSIIIGAISIVLYSVAVYIYGRLVK